MGAPTTPSKESPDLAEEEGYSTDAAEFERAAERLRRRGPQRRLALDEVAGPQLAWWPGPLQAAEQREAPPGYRLLPDEERLRTLEDLQVKLAELDQRYSRLPLKIETESQRQQQQALRAKLAEAEAAVRLFSRPRVLLEEELP